MRGLSKKMLISILTSVVVFVTMIATTFAWVGIFTYANTEKFNLNLKVQELDVNYFLTISATGQKNDFSDEANIIDIEKQILINQKKWSSDYINNLSNSQIEAAFKSNQNITPSTTTILENNVLDTFKSINMSNHDYFSYYESKIPFLKFDLYLSVGTKEGLQETTFINSNVYLCELEKTLEGTISSYKFYNRNPFKELPSPYGFLNNLPDYDSFKINSKNAARFALCLYEPIDINDSYDDSYLPNKTCIYQGGTKSPSIEGNNVYDLGGNLPEDSNTALKELLVVRPDYKENNNLTYKQAYEEALQNAITRGDGDLELTDENSKLWAKPEIAQYDDSNNKYNYLGIKDGRQTKMKVTVYFWFEGWDADCLSGIDQKPVSLNLTFTAGIDD